MRYLCRALAAAALTAAFIVPSSATAQINTVEVARTAQLLPEGVMVLVPVTVNCVADANGSVGVVLAQSTGNHLVSQGTGTTFVCTGVDQTVIVEIGNPSGFPFKQGKALATARLLVVDSMGNFIEVNAEAKEIHLKR